ncbi:hypothetical protein MRS76_11300 [Rhizobiaceae bacterium n13]|uniref:hypothetical protein n=1 Tax=Ferirhizobium litorale TaxID=2927786 RepID=UPI0024B3054F|nr:hypothetical protein [Fererhizobium litorale]MDI7862547.1 hypothetical protein [Fererhizobium litorale]
MDTVSENLHVAEIASTEDMPKMEKPDADAPEHVKCKWWREEVMELSREQLAPLVGFSAAAIKDFERPNKEIDPMARKRYTMACAAVSIGVEFDWLTTRLSISRPVEITMKTK